MTVRSVGVFTDYIGAYGRRLLQGAATFVHAHPGWQLKTLPFYSLRESPSFTALQADGLLASIFDHELLRRVLKLRIPVVNIAGDVTVPLPTVLPDDMAIGRLAADYFLDRGFRHFLCAVWPGVGYSRIRADAFMAAVAERGFSCLTAPAPTVARPHPTRELIEALTQSPKPLAVLGPNDRGAYDVMEVCHALSLSIPEQVAVLGVDDDDLVNAIARPPLASIEVPAAQVGYEAASVLRRLMEGKAPPAQPIFVSPGKVVVRASADIFAIGDPEVAQALRFIREHDARPIQVQDVLVHVALSRRTLERRFVKLLGRTPLEEIHRVHVERAKRLLTDTNMGMLEIASRAGFGDGSRFASVFRQTAGMAPSVYRSQFQLR